MKVPIYEQRVIVRIKDAMNLGDVEKVEEFLVDACAVLGMHIIYGPMVLFHKDTPDKSGVSGYIMFAESGLSVHTWPGLNYAAFDIFSCKEFNPKSFMEVVINYFEPMEYEMRSDI